MAKCEGPERLFKKRMRCRSSCFFELRPHSASHSTLVQSLSDSDSIYIALYDIPHRVWRFGDLQARVERCKLLASKIDVL